MPNQDDSSSTNPGGFDDAGAPGDLDEMGGRRRPTAQPRDVLRAIGEGGSLPYDDLPALSAADDQTIAELLPVWPRLAPERRRELLAALQQLSEEDATLDFNRVHLTALHDPDPATRILAIRGLWEHEGEEVMRLLTDLVREDPEGTVRAEAASALGQFVVSMEFGLLSEDGAEHLAETLRDVLEDATQEDEVRGRALEALGASSEEWVAEAIADQYETGTPRMRLASIRAMGRNASDDWLPVLIYNFDDDDAETRAAAATAAGELLLEAAVEPLSMLVDDSDSEVQIAAIEALGEIAGEAAEAALQQLLHREEHIAQAARRALAEARMMAADLDEGSEPA
ncbi:MAG: HEAT repeat domain-containing protein [Dehalococcoidia bacterium]|nr:HEAT repeat domain-containing protein [Dehalococcoidia bacterium]HRC63350.1 HEAT repeat domain-containing protein [Dehalococcoidia bacterium]